MDTSPLTTHMQELCAEYVDEKTHPATAELGVVTEDQILELLDDPEYKALPYVVRNRPFLTSSKLKALAECPYHAKLRYIDELSPLDEDADHFTIGQAFDDLLTRGEDYYEQRYAVVRRRNPDDLPGMVQLTTGQGETITNAAQEYRKRGFFPQKPTKKNIVYVVHGVLCKAELDHFDERALMFEDMKTTAIITTFAPMNYALQMGFYGMLLDYALGLPCSGSLCVVDKHSGWSRSHKWVFSRATLMSQFYQVEKLITQWKECSESGIWPHVDVSTDEGRKIAWASGLYPLCRHCRADSPTEL